MSTSSNSLLLEREAARELRCSVRTLQRIRARGELPYLEGRPVRIDAADLKKYIEAKKRRPVSAVSGRTDDEIAIRARQLAMRAIMRKRK